jgi:hypothetical protein
MGKVSSGYLKGYIATLAQILPNKDPLLCSTEEGVTLLGASVTEFMFSDKNGHYLVCSGSGSYTYSPGIKN